MTPPKPVARSDTASLWRHFRLFRRDILSAQPSRLYRAWMAEFRTPFFRSYLINQPDLIREVLKVRPMDFPKSNRIAEGLRPLLGNSVFLTNGEVWMRQRRIIDPAFEGGRLRDTFPAMLAAANVAASRLAGREGAVEIEAEASHVAADVIFRTLFSLPISDDIAQDVFLQFRDFQRSQPILNLAAFIPVPGWVPRFHRRRSRIAATEIRRLIKNMVNERMRSIEDGSAPDDLATKIMTTSDPETGRSFSPAEMVDQVAIFFLAGHETSASALAWALYLLASHPEAQERVAREAAVLGDNPRFSDMSKLGFTRNVFREALRLYPSLPMMVRETTKAERFRDRDLPAGSQVVISPWHLHRHERLWENPDEFEPDRYGAPDGPACLRDAFLPFSAGSRACPGAAFAMIEGPLLLSVLAQSLEFGCSGQPAPIPVAHLTVRSERGIWLTVKKRP